MTVQTYMQIQINMLNYKTDKFCFQFHSKKKEIKSILFENAHIYILDGSSNSKIYRKDNPGLKNRGVCVWESGSILRCPPHLHI